MQFNNNNNYNKLFQHLLGHQLHSRKITYHLQTVPKNPKSTKCQGYWHPKVSIYQNYHNSRCPKCHRCPSLQDFQNHHHLNRKLHSSCKHINFLLLKPFYIPCLLSNVLSNKRYLEILTHYYQLFRPISFIQQQQPSIPPTINKVSTALQPKDERPAIFDTITNTYVISFISLSIQSFLIFWRILWVVSFSIYFSQDFFLQV